MSTEEEKASLALEMMRAGWKNRRKMAWTSFWYALAYPVFVAVCWKVAPDLAEMIINIATPVYAFLGAVMVAYFGLATWDSIETTRKQP
jgi:peptidoglycan/LPS O-acetylase OafA/YrhL